ncbi:uncharacterized protein EV154DRAFT_496107 [Mucor mucedo]|uniref:uncharacterized protein n=1 Tax=Mucor mucedo TaxID=29922 RepID=UPI00221F3371|nr:uncharacterized protein EV154DRAFT_496107 [Mucor mucedo]KAI7895166.1 hypothetical protein EV154DRAFT_496107 [Mucor mucedo]
MLIGPTFSGKQTLAKELLQCRQVFFQVNTATEIPQHELPRVDYILIMVDMVNRYSLDLLEEALNRMTSKYITHHLAIVVSKVDIPEKWNISKNELHTLLQPFPDVQLFYANLESQSERRTISEQITRLVQLTTLQYRNLDTDYVKSYEFYCL